MKRIALYLFGVVCLGELLSTLISAEPLHLVCKPLIMLTLGAYYLSSVATENRSNPLVLAMLLSCVGDILLMLIDKSGLFFKLGLFSFLLAHIAFIFAYRQHKDEGSATKLQGIHKMRLAFPVILSASGLLVVLYPGLGDLKIPVIIYTLVIMFMVLNALFRHGLTNTASFFMVFCGAILFMISDSILAISKFREPIEHSAFLVMSTYCLAQFLIVKGLLKHST